MTGTPKGSTESDFMEKPGIEPATPGLQDIGLSLHHGGFIFFYENGKQSIWTIIINCLLLLVLFL